MTHPYELLADLVDGTLAEGDLAGVHAHLDTCASCRRDLADATAGVRAARSLPVEPAPADLHRRVLGDNGGRGTPSWYRWAGVAAAAAAIVAVAIVLPNVGTDRSERVGGSENTTRGQAAEASSEAAPSADEVLLTVEDRDYDAADLQDLAASTDQAVPDQLSSAGAARGDPTTAVRCVSQAFEDQHLGRLTRLIRARFEGRDAYIAVALEGPGADEPPDTRAVFAASSDDCSVLSFASARI